MLTFLTPGHSSEYCIRYTVATPCPREYAICALLRAGSTHYGQALLWTRFDDPAIEHGQCHPLEIRLPLPELHECVILSKHSLLSASAHCLFCQPGLTGASILPRAAFSRSWYIHPAPWTPQQTPTAHSRSTLAVPVLLSLRRQTFNRVTVSMTSWLLRHGLSGRIERKLRKLLVG